MLDGSDDCTSVKKCRIAETRAIDVLLIGVTVCVFSAGDDVNYCYAEATCSDEKIPTLEGEVLMTKSYCCAYVNGASWGGVRSGHCESCTATTTNTTVLPASAASKCLLTSTHTLQLVP